MVTFIQFVVLGLGTSAAYTLLAQGLVLIYRGSAVVNFAQGAFALVGALVFNSLRSNHGWGFTGAAVVAVIVVGLLGIASYQLIMRSLASASAVMKAVATLGILLLVQGIASVSWGTVPINFSSSLPSHTYNIDGVTVTLDRILLLVIAVLVTITLWLTTKYATVGLALRANAENRRAASALGWSPHVLGSLTWGLGGALAAIAGILVGPLAGISTGDTPLLVIPVLAAVLVGSFESFPVTFLSALVIGIGQSLLSNYVSITGATGSVPFVVILLYLIVRGEKINLRTSVAQRLSILGRGRTHPLIAAAVVVTAGLAIALVDNVDFAAGVTNSLGWATILLSVVVLLGYAGQLSLAQYAVGGIGALVAAKAVIDLHAPFLVALIIAVVLCAVVGAIFSVPALRTRGINLAIITLGLSVALNDMVFNGSLTGGYLGLPVGSPNLFGWDFGAIAHPGRYAMVSLGLFVVCAIVVSNVRRGAAGIRLIAVRTNERAAAALGVDVFAAKIFAFSVAAGIAAVGGIIIAFVTPTLTFTTYSPLYSVQTIAYGLVGGAGYIAGAPVGSTLAPGGFGTWVVDQPFSDANPIYVAIAGAVLLLLTVVTQPDGIVHANLAMAGTVVNRVRYRDGPRDRTDESAPPIVSEPAVRDVAGFGVPEPLRVSEISVRFGSVVVLDRVSLNVAPGEIVGLIGPNGAGKTTLIDAITGFVPIQTGELRLGERQITSWSAFRRARAGLSRSFQSLELFDASSVAENLQIASDSGSLRDYARGLVWPRSVPLSSQAGAALEAFDLTEHLADRASSLSYAKRRLVAVARAAAGRPSVLLLDEPAAGLGDLETAELGRVVRRLAAEWGLGVLIVEHNMPFVMGICDRIVVLNFGRQIAEGPPALVRADPAVQAAYLGVPVAAGSVETPLPGPAVDERPLDREGRTT